MNHANSIQTHQGVSVTRGQSLLFIIIALSAGGFYLFDLGQYLTEANPAGEIRGPLTLIL